jgi:hypothetical protein
VHDVKSLSLRRKDQETLADGWCTCLGASLKQAQPEQLAGDSLVLIAQRRLGSFTSYRCIRGFFLALGTIEQIYAVRLLPSSGPVLFGLGTLLLLRFLGSLPASPFVIFGLGYSCRVLSEGALPPSVSVLVGLRLHCPWLNAAIICSWTAGPH